MFTPIPMDIIHSQRRGTVKQMYLAIRSGVHKSTCKILTQDSLSQQSQASGSWEGIWRVASQPWKSFDFYGDYATPVCPAVRLKYPWLHGGLSFCLEELHSPWQKNPVAFSKLFQLFEIRLHFMLSYSSLLQKPEEYTFCSLNVVHFSFLFPIHLIPLIDPYLSLHRKLYFC